MNETEQETKTEGAAFMAEMAEVGDFTVGLEMSVSQGWVLLSCLQLACRHPEMGEALRGMALEIARGLARALPLGPIGRDIADRGFEGIPE